MYEMRNTEHGKRPSIRFICQSLHLEFLSSLDLLGGRKGRVPALWALTEFKHVKHVKHIHRIRWQDDYSCKWYLCLSGYFYLFLSLIRGLPVRTSMDWWPHAVCLCISLQNTLVIATSFRKVIKSMLLHRIKFFDLPLAEKNKRSQMYVFYKFKYDVHCCIESCLAIYLCGPCLCYPMLDDARAPRSVKHNTYIPNLDVLSDTVAWTVLPAWFCTGLSTCDTLCWKPRSKTFLYGVPSSYTPDKYTHRYLGNWFIGSGLTFLFRLSARLRLCCTINPLPTLSVVQYSYLWIQDSLPLILRSLLSSAFYPDDNLSHIVLLGKIQRLIVR